jgi:hypothetical protein
MPRAFVDTNVLFPFSVMDLMLALSSQPGYTRWLLTTPAGPA